MISAQIPLFDQPKPIAVFYRVGDPTPHRVFHDGYAERWPSIQESVAATLGCAADEVTSTEVYWGEDNSAEIVLVGGKVAGSFYRPLSKKAAAAIRRTLQGEPAPVRPSPKKRPKSKAPNQREMLLPIQGKKADIENQPAQRPVAGRKAG